MAHISCLPSSPPPLPFFCQGIIPTSMADLEAARELGMDWSLREGYAWPEDKEHCEEAGRMLAADPAKVSLRAKKRGLPQMGTLGAGNHYAEVQVVDAVYDPAAARRMGIDRVGQVVVMIHSGSRGLGHQVATDALTSMEAAMARDGIAVNDRQLACARIASREGQDYLAAMAAAANYAWVNRSAMTFLARSAFASVFGKSADELDMHVVYDVSHNIAKMEQHTVNGEHKTLLVHRKGATRAFPPHQPHVPAAYQKTGHLPRRGAGPVPQRVPPHAGHGDGAGCAEGERDRHSGGVPQAGHGGSARVVQGRVRRGGRVPRGGHQSEVRAVAAAVRGEGVKKGRGGWCGVGVF